MKSWDDRVDAVWADASDEEVGGETIARIDALAAERGVDDARAEFERAGARDSAGYPADAVVLYRRALALRLDDDHRAQCIVQLASSLRNMGEYDEALTVIQCAESLPAGSPYRDAIATVYALTLASSGRPAHGLSVALMALVPHLPRYHRSMSAYAQEIAELDA